MTSLDTFVSTEADLARLDALIAEQEAVMLTRTTRSQALRAEASDVLAGGVASSWQDAPPCAVWIACGMPTGTSTPTSTAVSESASPVMLIRPSSRR